MLIARVALLGAAGIVALAGQGGHVAARWWPVICRAVVRSIYGSDHRDGPAGSVSLCGPHIHEHEDRVLGKITAAKQMSIPMELHSTWTARGAERTVRACATVLGSSVPPSGGN